MDPACVVGVDNSPGFLASARARVTDVRSAFCVGNALSLPLADHTFDAVVSGLTLNFVPDPGRAAAELVRLTAAGGVVAGYVWDYAEGMAMMRYFWDAAVTLDPTVAGRDQGRRFPVCRAWRIHLAHRSSLGGARCRWRVNSAPATNATVSGTRCAAARQGR